MDAAERLFTSNVVHQNEAHRSSVVSCGDGSVPLLTRCILKQKIFVKKLYQYFKFIHQISQFSASNLACYFHDFATHPYL